MNLKQMDTIQHAIREELTELTEVFANYDLKEGTWGNPEIHEGEGVLNRLTPFTFATGPWQSVVLVLDREGTEIHRYTESNR